MARQLAALPKVESLGGVGVGYDDERRWLIVRYPRP